MSDQVTRLKIDDEAFLVASLIDRCPKVMMLRELVQNAIEAAMAAPPGERRVVIDAVSINGTRKLRVWNTGPGLDEPNLYRMCDLSSSIGKLKGLDGNFGMGAKVAALPSNHFGIRYRSCTAGLVHEVTLGKRDEIYGRLHLPARRFGILPGTQRLVDIQEVTVEARAEVRDTGTDWTEVVLMGMRAEQDTVISPYDNQPVVPIDWLPLTLYRRYFRLPAGVEIEIAPEFHWHAQPRRFETLHERALSAFAGYEAVPTIEGITVHFFYDTVCAERPWENQSSENALQTTSSYVGLISKNEIYDLQTDSPWAYEAPNYGITFGARHISVFVELPPDYPVTPDAYRQFLRHRGRDQAQVTVREFAPLVVAARPSWLKEVIEAIGGKSSAGGAVITNLASLCRELELNRLEEEGPTSELPVELQFGAAAAGEPLTETRESCGFDILLLRDEQDVNDRWLRGRAACFYPSTKQLYVNTLYSAVCQLRERLRTALPDLAGAPGLADAIHEVAIECIVMRVARALLFAIAKHLDPETWQEGHIEKAMSPESLSVSADDFHDLVPWAKEEVRVRSQLSPDTAYAPGGWPQVLGGLL